MMSKLVTIYGGSGFVGRYIVLRMVKEGWRVRVAVRNPNEALFVKTYGVVGQVEPVACNIRDDASVRSVMRGANAVVNCVGVLNPAGKNTFASVHAEGAVRIARIAAEVGVANLVHISSIGADAGSESEYQRTKAAGELGDLAAFPKAVVLRPSIIFGNEDRFFNRFAEMARLGPILPVVGADTRFQPVYVDDVAQVAVLGATGRADSGVYELGGPDVVTFRALMGQMLAVIQRRRLVLNVPFFLADIIGGVLDFVQMLTAGLIKNGMITRDQVQNLRQDNVVASGARGLVDLGITPTAIGAVIPEYLWRYRPSGQYAAIKNSAKNLKKV